MLTKAQLEKRLSFVTGSDAAVICGLSPYKSKVQLWLEKTQRQEQEDISNANHIKFGNYMEDGVAQWFVDDSGKKLQPKNSRMIVHPVHSWMAGNIDFAIEGENAILECKTALRTDGWGDGDNFIPQHYLMQAAHYCAVGGFDRCYIAVVFTMTRELRWYVYERNTLLEDKLIKLEQDFWMNNVVADVAPIPTTEKDILNLCKITIDKPIMASPEIETNVYSLASVKAKIKELEDQEELHRNAIATFMCENEYLMDSTGSQLLTWKLTAPVTSFDRKKFEERTPGFEQNLYKSWGPKTSNGC